MTHFPFTLLEATRWNDYELLDSGDGLKLERFGKYVFERPESQALWRRALPQKDWDAAHAVFEPTGEESGGHWNFKKKVEEKWVMTYPLQLPPSVPPNTPGIWGEERKGALKFYVMTTPGRHLGVFPETASHWDLITDCVRQNSFCVSEHGQDKSCSTEADSPPNILNLFGYTGLASLAAASEGARVTHVDASKKSVTWARENQELSALSAAPIRWIVEDALKYVQREAKRGVKYDGIILDPPKFGRGPKGEVWEVYKSLPTLLDACRACLSDHPLFFIVTLYAARASAIHIAQALDELTRKYKGTMDSGELVTREKSAGRLISQAVYARWRA